ncbi:replication initiator [Streptomyces sp. NPDC060064]|uniref:replication initiator n=1 Tax=Streptomyces sp. NPDC060064 TaxID=3347049 RepID=UPI0036B0DB74
MAGAADRRHLATAAGQPQSKIGDHLRLSFAKVAEYQRRGAVHFHAVIRLDGPDGPTSPPPTWASAQLLEAAVCSAADSAHVSMPYTPGLGEHVFRWDDQLDVHPIRRAFADDMGEFLTAKNAHFLLVVKDSQPLLFNALRSLPRTNVTARHAERDNGHGRRQLRVVKALTITGLGMDFPEFAQAARNMRFHTNDTTGKLTRKTTYAITDLTSQQAPPQRSSS